MLTKLLDKKVFKTMLSLFVFVVNNLKCKIEQLFLILLNSKKKKEKE